MAEYRFRWNKYSKIHVHADTIPVISLAGFLGPVPLSTKITNYQLPPEEKELALDEIPQPDFQDILKDIK